MQRVALYLGGACPPNMEAYLDSLLYRTAESYTLLTTDQCDVPSWVGESDRFTIFSHSVPTRGGSGRLWTARDITSAFLDEHDPAEIRQITQPRWHAPGVLLGAVGSETTVCTRAAASMFSEYQRAPNRVPAWLANNVLGRAVFLADRIYTPEYGGVHTPWYGRATPVVEPREVNRDRFDSASVDPLPDLFTRSNNRVLTVGRVSRRKGIDLLLEVAAQQPNVQFAIVGPVSDEGLAQRARNRSNVRLHDPVRYTEMPRLYAACDVLLSTSRIEWGGVSRAMLEAKAMNRPVVALDRGDAAHVSDRVVDAEPRAIGTALQSVLA